MFKYESISLTTINVYEAQYLPTCPQSHSALIYVVTHALSNAQLVHNISIYKL